MDSQDAILTTRFRAVGIDISRQRNHPLENSVDMLHDVTGTVAIGPFEALFPFYVEHIALYRHLAILFVNTRTSNRARNPWPVSSSSPSHQSPPPAGRQCAVGALCALSLPFPRGKTGHCISAVLNPLRSSRTAYSI